MKTSKADFQLFKEECEYWINYFGLQGWRVFYIQKKLEGAYAECISDIKDRNASILLSSEFVNEIVTKDNLQIIAFHEVCELLFTRLEILASARFVREDEITEERHNLIRTLENTIFKEKKR